MMQDEIIQFAKLIVQNVRDTTIKGCDGQLSTDNLNSPIAKRWQDAKNKGNIDDFEEMIISDCVDDTIFCLLQAIDQGILNLSFNADNGESVNLSKSGLGELSGWYMGEWRSKYSKERCSNDLE